MTILTKQVIPKTTQETHRQPSKKFQFQFQIEDDIYRFTLAFYITAKLSLPSFLRVIRNWLLQATDRNDRNTNESISQKLPYFLLGEK